MRCKSPSPRIQTGATSVIAEHFGGVAGAQRVLIFGSWAARFSGVDGPPPADIDVLLIGDGISQREALRAATRAQDALGVDVTPVLCTPERWSDPTGNPFLIEIHQRPAVEVGYHASSARIGGVRTVQ